MKFRVLLKERDQNPLVSRETNKYRLSPCLRWSIIFLNLRLLCLNTSEEVDGCQALLPPTEVCRYRDTTSDCSGGTIYFSKSAYRSPLKVVVQRFVQQRPLAAPLCPHQRDVDVVIRPCKPLVPSGNSHRVTGHGGGKMAFDDELSRDSASSSNLSKIWLFLLRQQWLRRGWPPLLPKSPTLSPPSQPALTMKGLVVCRYPEVTNICNTVDLIHTLHLCSCTYIHLDSFHTH